MLPESVLNTLAGGLIGLFGSLIVLVIRDSLETRRRRRQLIDAIDSATRSCSTSAALAAYTGRGKYFNPAEQFLATFWRDLPLLGTYTQMMIVTYFSLLIEATKDETPPSKDELDALEKIRQSLLKLLESERKGQRQNIGYTQNQNCCVNKKE